MKIALIGAGNLATVLGHALCNARHDIVQVYSQTMTAANRGRARHFGVFYPMQTFSKTRIVDFRNIPVFIEADSPATIKSITEVAQSVSNNVRELCSSDRRYLHLAAVWACNYTNFCYDMAAEVLQKVGLPFDIMLPLTDETAKKVHELLPHEAQTGRYDENIIAAQMQLMNDNPRAQQLYQLMAQSIHERSKK